MKLKKVLGVVSNKYKDTQTCESCGCDFECGISLGGCWCMKVRLEDEQRADLESRFAKCLCPKCLEAMSLGEHI